METFVNISLYFAYILFGIAVVGAIVLPIVNAASQPKLLIKPIAALVGLVILFFIGYAFAGDSLNARAISAGVTSGISKMVGGALICMYVLFAAALIGIVFTEINKAFK